METQSENLNYLSNEMNEGKKPFNNKKNNFLVNLDLVQIRK